MESGKLVFAQLMDFVPRHDFDACPRQFQGLFFCFSWGCQRPISAARTVTLWTLPNGPSLLQLEHTSLSGIAFLSGPTCDRANRVTQACRLKRIASQHDRRSGHIGDFTDHLCPCPSILRWALPCGREGLFSKRWQDRSVASDYRNPVADNPPTSKCICIIARFHCLHRTPHLAGNSPRGEGPGSLSISRLAVPVELFLPSLRTWSSRGLPAGPGLQYIASAWAEDRATRGRDPSAGSGAKTGVGGRTPPLGIPGLAPKR